jgi:DHA1 family tetracycline resistance protein-like MFS transporter
MLRFKIVILLTVLLDMVGFGVVIATVPFRLEHINFPDYWSPILFTVFSLCTFLISPLLGSYSDRKGRKPVLLYSLLMSAVGWLLFSFSHHGITLILSTIICGLGSGNFAVAQSAMVDIAKDEKEKVENLGMAGTVYGLGLLIGPVVGGILGHYGSALPFFTVGLLSFLNLVLSFIFLPETNKNKSGREFLMNPFKPIMASLSEEKIRFIYIVWFLFNVVIVGLNAIFIVYLHRVFEMGAFAAGLFFALGGLIIGFNQAVAIHSFWLKYFSGKKLIFMMLGVLAISLLVMMSSHIFWFVWGVIFMSFAHAVLRVVLTSETFNLVTADRRGEAAGILSALGAFAAVIGPAMAGWVFAMKVYYPLLGGVAICLVALVVFHRNHHRLVVKRERIRRQV